MKNRIFSIVLALCLCCSSQFVSYANQENVFTEESADPADSDESTVFTESSKEIDTGLSEPSQSEDRSTDEVTNEPESNEDADINSSEEPSQPEDHSKEKVTDEPESSDDVRADSPEGPSQPEDSSAEEVTDELEDSSTEEITDELESSEDVDTDLPEEPSQPENTVTEESTDELGISEDETAALPEVDLLSEEFLVEESTDGLVAYDSIIPTPAEAYNAMIALKKQDKFKEGTTWTNDEPYSDSKGYYRWKGGTLDGKNIVAVGCVAFSFELSDAAFGSLPARMYASGDFSYEDIKVGDILRLNNDNHTVIVLEVSDTGVVIAEGNLDGKVHWGRTLSKEDVTNGTTSHYITRYPEGYIPPDDPAANESIGSGTLDGGLTWNLTKAGTLTISGNGAMPDYSSAGEQPWSAQGSQIKKVVIEKGVTSIGACAFWNCGVLGVEIPSSVRTIGNNAFCKSSIVSVAIPSSVKTINDSAFCECPNLRTVTISEGLETIAQNAFRGCRNLAYIELPASIGEVGAAAFMECDDMTDVEFSSGNKQVKLGDNLFTRCYGLMNVKLPNNIDRIGDGMFQNCLMLGGVEIPQGAESIGMQAFASSAISTIIIPDSVTIIESAAFASCPLTDIYFTGTEAQWNSIHKMADTASVVSKATIHYNYVPPTNPDNSEKPGDNKPGGDNTKPDDSDNKPSDNTKPDDSDNKPGDSTKPGDGDTKPGDGNKPSDSNKPGDNKPGDDNTKPGDNKPEDNNTKPGESVNPGNNNPGNNNPDNSNDSAKSSHTTSPATVAATWKPKTPDEIKRYAYMGKEVVQYTPSEDNAYPIVMENAMQGPMCFQVFEAVLGDYTIGRTYNIYAPFETAYSMDQEIQLTIKIPSEIYQKDREYKLICVTEGGQPVIYDDLDNTPDTITIKTNKFYAYALIYK